jgi:MEMO1 family protein
LDGKPRLRALDFQPVLYEGQQMWLLQDPLELSEAQLIMPAPVAQMLVYCDGRHTPEEIGRALTTTLGVDIDLEVVANALRQLDDNFLLDNARYRDRAEERLSAYRAQGHRAPALADLAYPADPQELSRKLDDYARDDDLDGWRPWHGRAIISPHIDYPRGGLVYSQVWRRARAAIKDAELVLIFGTDHNGSPGAITLTRQPYATPYGVIPTDEKLIDALAGVIGPAAFTEELHHLKEHSVELSAVWFHHVRGSDPCPLVPILCGSFHHYLSSGRRPDDDPAVARFIDALRRETAGRRVLAVASVDLAHVGPTFGDDFVMDGQRRQALIESDNNLMEAINLGEVSRFYNQIATINDGYRICGFSSIYLLLRYLGQTSGRQIAYAHCPADPKDNSLVSICGMLLD